MLSITNAQVGRESVKSRKARTQATFGDGSFEAGKAHRWGFVFIPNEGIESCRLQPSVLLDVFHLRKGDTGSI